MTNNETTPNKRMSCELSPAEYSKICFASFHTLPCAWSPSDGSNDKAWIPEVAMYKKNATSRRNMRQPFIFCPFKNTPSPINGMDSFVCKSPDVIAFNTVTLS